MDIAEIATMAFIASGMTDNAGERMICRKSAGEQSCWFLTDGDIWCASTLRRMY